MCPHRDLLEWVQSETSGYYKDTSLASQGISVYL